jgi:hypothetical protein
VQRLLIFLVSLAVVLLPHIGWAQRDDYRLQIKRSPTPITVDGKLDEAVWQGGEPARKFYQSFPLDTSYAWVQTEVWAASDETTLYFGARCYRTGPNVVVTSLRRDFDGGSSDVFGVYIDPFNDQTNGFLFAVSPLGVQREGLLSGGGNIDASWDNAWKSAVVQYDSVYIVEMAIPLSTLRYPPDTPLWRVNFGRGDLTLNEYSSWVPVPRNFSLTNLLFTGRLEWETAPPAPRKTITLIPYVLTSGSADYRNSTYTNKYNFGGDVKVPVSSSLNLDVTVNPDFAQADVDVQQINLSRFSLFFPERRQFFIENSDLFARFGFSEVRPFFSRRIGLSSPIVFGARLSGKIGRDWRLGVMSIQTEGKSSADVTANNYTVVAVQRQVFGTSNLGLIVVNRQGVSNGALAGADFNRVVGVDFNLQSPNNRWRGKLFQHVSVSPNQLPNAFANSAWLLYTVPKFTVEWNHEYVGRGYRPEVGFVPRLDFFDPLSEKSYRYGYLRLQPEARYVMFPKGTKLNRITAFLNSDLYMLDTLNYGISDREHWTGLNFLFLNNAEIELAYGNIETKLVFPADFGLNGQEPLVPLGRYVYHRYGLSANSNPRKRLSAGIDAFSGGFFNGTRHFVAGNVSYRLQPWGTFTLSAQHNDLMLKAAQGRAQISLYGFRSEMSFSRSVFWTTFIQVASQSKNVNHFSRLQWRFAPMSDLFVVYSENYDDVLAVKNRSLVVKLVYWLNLRV